jgi:hypothetical protein
MLGTRFKAATRAQLRAASTPPSGASPEAIWHQFYDTQTYTDATTTRLTFFQSTNVDATITNMPAAGQLPDPQWLSIYNVTLDFLNEGPTVSSAGAATGQLNDVSLLLMVGRPTWTLNISDKRYGPYSLSALHGTGAPAGNVGGGSGAANDFTIQYGHNALNPGWNYSGTLIIPPKTNWNVEVVWSGAQDLTGDVKLRLSLFGILSRRVL